MNDQELNRLFERFRRRGDVHALGEIFDASAPELLRVAMSLVREPGEADDLLQETFLTAIERAQRYEPGRLVAWLLGILVLHARDRRRLRRREPDPTRLARRETAPPEAEAEGRELEQALERALAELSARERAVLEAYLYAGKGAAEIASEVGAAPGAVRMQIHRGLERLRRALPAGLALGTAGALQAQGLAAVRATVLRAGETAAANLAPGAGSALGTGTAGVLMTKKLVVAGIVAALAAGLLWLRGTGRSSSVGAEGTGRSVVLAPPRAVPSPELEPARSREARGGQPNRTPAGDPSARELGTDRAGLRGRVVEHDGSPVPGLPVALLQLDEAELHPVLGTTPAHVQLVAEGTHTDEEGGFVLRDAQPKAVHALGLDLGGERATLRMLAANPAPGVLTELGDVVLAPFGAVRGRVVDESGRAVPGARVRLGAIPEGFFQRGLVTLEPGGAVVEWSVGGGPESVFELPAWLSALESKLPLATTATDAEGRFALRKIGVGRLRALVDAPDFARTASAEGELEAGRELDVGDVVLAVGQSVRALVLDGAGVPAAGAEARAGVRSLLARLEGGPVPFGPPRRTDAQGRVAFEHLAEGEVALLARRDPVSPWVAGQEEDGVLVVRLPASSALVVELRDARGRPVAAPEFLLRREVDPGMPGAFGTPPCPHAAERVDAEGTRHRLTGLASGSYHLLVRAAGLAQASCSFRIDAGVPPTLQVVLGELRACEVRVLEASTQRPVADAQVRVEGLERMPPEVLASARTDAAGRAALALASRTEQPLWLRVEHPRFAPRLQALEGPGPFDVALTAGGRVIVRCADASLARAGGTLTFLHRGAAVPEYHLPRLVTLPGEDEVVLERLPAGGWTWNLFEPLSARDPLGWLMEEPQHLEQGKFELADGATVEVTVGARPARPEVSGGAALSVVVRIEGRPAGELGANLIPRDGPDTTRFTRGKGGRFRFEGVPAGPYLLLVQDAPSGRVLEYRPALVRQELELAAGEVRTLEIDLARIPVRLRVLTARNGAAATAQVRLRPLDEGATTDGATGVTDAEGRAHLELPAPGRYVVLARHEDEGLARIELAVGERGAPEATLTLSEGVACAGQIVLAPGFELGEERGTLIVTSPDDPWLHLTLPVAPIEGRAPFRIVGLAPGRFHARLWGGEETLAHDFELPPWGDAALELRFTRGRATGSAAVR